MDCSQLDPADNVLGTATCSSLATSEQEYVPPGHVSSTNYPHQSSILSKLSIDLIKTYRHINTVGLKFKIWSDLISLQPQILILSPSLSVRSTMLKSEESSNRIWMQTKRTPAHKSPTTSRRNKSLPIISPPRPPPNHRPKRSTMRATMTRTTTTS